MPTQFYGNADPGTGYGPPPGNEDIEAIIAQLDLIRAELDQQTSEIKHVVHAIHNHNHEVVHEIKRLIFLLCGR